jgi:hypothetical protein
VREQRPTCSIYRIEIREGDASNGLGMTVHVRYGGFAQIGVLLTDWIRPHDAQRALGG